ncbi:MAG: hypothetical protein KBS51_04530 [Lachnospiraceae bacterium]|nr:hypothetical protein [Candidatus Darwinimomas equi]
MKISLRHTVNSLVQMVRHTNTRISSIIHRGIAVLLAAILLAGAVPFAVFADPVNDEENVIPNGESGTTESAPNDMNAAPASEATFVILPQGFTQIDFDKNLINGSKLTGKFVDFNSSFYLGANQGYGIHFDGVQVVDLTKNNFLLSDKFNYNDEKQPTIRGAAYFRKKIDPKPTNGVYGYLTANYSNPNTTKCAVIVFTTNNVSEYGSISYGASKPGDSYTNTKDGNSKTNSDWGINYSGTQNYLYNKGNVVTGAVITVAYPNAWGTTSGDTQGYTTQETVIKATAKPGYVFDHWEKNGIDIGGTSSMSVQCNGSIDAYVAVFKPKAEAKGVHVYNATEQSGTLVGGTVTGDKSYEGADTSTVIRAIPDTANGWNFDHWECSIGGDASRKIVSYSKEYTAPVTNSLDSYYAYFTQKPNTKGVHVIVADECSAGGKVTGDKVYEGTDTSTVIRAIPDSGWYFDHWECLIGGDASRKIVSYSKEYTAPVTNSLDNYYAYFTQKPNTKGVHVFNRTGIDDGDPDPNEPNTTGGVVSGEKSYEGTDTSIVIRAIPAEGWYFDHWECSIGRDASRKIVSYSKEYTAPVTNSVDNYYAYFTQEPQTKGVHVYSRNSDGDGADGGTVSGEKFYEGTDTSTVIHAIPDSGWYFDHWECSTNGGQKKIVSYSKEYTAPVTNSVDNYYACFTRYTEKLKGVHVYINNATGGSVSGEKYYEGTDTSTVIRAIPDSDSGWYFDHWECIIGGDTSRRIVSYSKEYTAPVTNSVDKYYAHFTKDPHGVFTKASNELHQPVEYGTVSGDAFRNNNGQLTYQTTITATAKKGYVFDHWDLQDYHEPTKFTEISKDSTITVKVNDAVERYYAVFIPMWGVKATVNNTEAGTVSGGTDGYVNGQEIKQTTLQAYAKDSSFVFDHWELATVIGGEEPRDSDYKRVSDSNPINVPVKRESGEYKYYKAVFVEKDSANGVYTTACDESHNSASFGTVSGDAFRNSNGQLIYQTTLTASAKRGYVFDHWDLQDSHDPTQFNEVSKDSTITVKVNDEVDKYYAVFVPMWGVKTSASPIEAGYTSGDTDGYVNGQEIKQTTIQATLKSDEYVFSHWQLTNGSMVSSSATVTVPVNREDEMVEYVAVFEKLSDAFGVTTQPDDPDHGSTTGDTLRKKDGQLIDQTTIQAIPSSNEWVFDHWLLSTKGGEAKKVSNANPYNVKVKDQHDVYTAVFVSAFAADGVYTTVSDQQCGTTSGDSLRNINGQVVSQTTIEAFPSSNEWIFDYWELRIPGESPVKVSIANPYTVAVDDCVYIYTAYFRARNGKTNPEIEIKGHATGITDSVIKKKERLFTVPVLGVDRNYILQLAEQAVQESSSRNDIPPYAGDSPRLSALSAALQLQERKNEEELKDTGFDFVTSDGEIITISDIPVTSAVTDAAGTVVEDKYGDIYKSEVIKVSETIVPVTFNDGKRTVIWSNTGAQEDDRLLIIQQGMMFADRNITPIADKDGNIVFSTSDFNGSRFILVKVGYK